MRQLPSWFTSICFLFGWMGTWSNHNHMVINIYRKFWGKSRVFFGRWFHAFAGTTEFMEHRACRQYKDLGRLWLEQEGERSIAQGTVMYETGSLFRPDCHAPLERALAMVALLRAFG
jgi:hypothetical protein